MSTTDPQTDDVHRIPTRLDDEPDPDNIDDERTEKTVTVMAYAAAPEIDHREFADQFTDRDMYERKTRETTSQKVVWTDEDGEEHDHIVLEDDLFDVLQDAVDPEHDRASVVRETKEKTKFKHSLSSATSDVADISNAPDELAGGVESGFWDDRWKTDEGRTAVRVSSYGINDQRVLAHRSRRSDDDMYESEYTVPAAKWEIQFDGPPELVDVWADDVVGWFLQDLADIRAFGKIRITDCEETVSKNGDCFGSV